MVLLNVFSKMKFTGDASAGKGLTGDMG